MNLIFLENEFNLILDENLLPTRYNQIVVNQFFKLTENPEKDMNGIDFQSFMYYDFALRIFSIKNQTKPWYLNEAEFISTLQNQLFNSNMMQELQQIPTTNYTSVSYILSNITLLYLLGYLSNVYLS
ncbi:MAG: hypothetical protein ACK5YA_01145 [bacterium]